MTALVQTFGAKAFNDTELRNASLAGRNTIVISTGETNKNVTVKVWKNTWPTSTLHLFFCDVLNSIGVREGILLGGGKNLP